MKDAMKVQEVIPNIQEKINNFIDKNNLYLYKNIITLVIFVGGTGSGKSTFMNLVAGQKLIIKNNYENLVLEAPNEKISKISHNRNSETEIPNLWFDSTNKIIFCDCPGFFDTKGSVQETINIFSIVALLNFTKRVKMVLLMSKDESIASKGQLTRQQFDIIENLSRVKSSQKGICMILTKVNFKLTNVAQLRKHLSKMGAFEEKNRLLNLVAKDSSKRIFVFPEPSDDAIINSEYQEFSSNDMNRFIQFVKDENDMFQANDKVPLTETALHFILSLINNSKEIGTLIQQIISNMKNDCESEIKDSTSAIQNWRNIINDIKNYKYYILSKLITKLKENFKSHKYLSIYRQIEQTHSLIPILKRIDSSILTNGKARAYQNFIESASIYNVKNDINEGLDSIIKILNSEEQRIYVERRRLEEVRRRIREERRRREALERQRQEEKRRQKEEERRQLEEKLRLEEEQRQFELEQERIRAERERKRISREKRLAAQRERELQEQLRNFKPRVQEIHHYSDSDDDFCQIF